MSITTPDATISALNATSTSIVSSNTGVQAFATIPIEDDPTPPNYGQYTLVSDLVDFNRPLPGLQSASSDPAGVAQQYGQDLNFDFDAGEPACVVQGSTGTAASYVAGELQVLQWIAKALDVQIGQYQIYGSQVYGSLLPSLVGMAGPDQALFSEVARTVVACAQAHPRVKTMEVDAVFRAPSAALAGVFIIGRLTLDTAVQPINVNFFAH